MRRYNNRVFIKKEIQDEMKSVDFGYSQKIIEIENGADQKIHIKMTVHESRTSLVSGIISELKTFVKESNKETGFNVDFEKDIVVDFYQIGDWNKKGKYENGKLEYIR